MEDSERPEAPYTMLDAFVETLKSPLPRELQQYPWFIMFWTIFTMTLGLFWSLCILHFIFFVVYNCLVVACAMRYFSMIGT